jgi:hypothetical protein
MGYCQDGFSLGRFRCNLVTKGPKLHVNQQRNEFGFGWDSHGSLD